MNQMRKNYIPLYTLDSGLTGEGEDAITYNMGKKFVICTENRPIAGLMEKNAGVFSNVP